MEKAFDRTIFNSLDASAKRMTESYYTYCHHACNEKINPNMAGCKQTCFETIQVPYKMMLHQAQDSEENLYRQCLASKLPNIKHEDYTTCTKDIYAQRVEILSHHFANTAEQFLGKIH